MHFFSSYFMEKLRREKEPFPQFSYSDVRRWGKPSGGLFKLVELHVPINKRNLHWLSLRVIFAMQRIELRDSYGFNETNRQYLEDMLRYLFHEFHNPNIVSEEGPEFVQWKSEWTLVDESENCPHQENNDDCGLFMVLFIYLLSQGVKLNSSTFCQSLLYSNNSRTRLVFVTLKSALVPSSEVSHHFPKCDYFSVSPCFCTISFRLLISTQMKSFLMRSSNTTRLQKLTY